MSHSISRTCVWAAALAGLLCLSAAADAVAAARYAAPGGSGTACTEAVPCDIQTAVTAPAVVDGDEVVLASGTYDTGNDPVIASKAIDLHGTAGSARPLIDSSAGVALVIGTSGRLEDVEVQASAPGIGVILNPGVVAQRVVSIAGASGAIGCFLNPDQAAPPLLQESACISNGNGGTAVLSNASVSAGTEAAATIQDVTAVATGPSSGGVKASSNGSAGSVTLRGINVIASGTAADAIADGGSGGSFAFAQLSFSDYDSQQELANAAVTDPGYDSNVTGPALLVDPAAGDVHQRAGSWTIDRGGYVNGSDIDGDVRPQGAAPDIGADELPVLAKAQRPKCFGQSATIAPPAPAPGPIEGTSARDVIVGTPGPDVIDSGAGKDLICGLGGRDTIRSGGGADTVRGGAAGDKLIGGGGRDLLLGSGGPDRIKGGAGKDRLAGGGGRDRIAGGPGNDRLAGGGGRDRLSGGRGKDKLFGGRGRDRCRATPKDRIRSCP